MVRRVIGSGKIATAAHTMYLPVAYHNCGGPVTHFASWHLAMATPNLKILETVRRHYNDRFLPVVAASGAPQNGRLGVPPGPGLGVVIREEFLRSGKVEIDFVDEGTADRSRVVWRRGESMSPKGRMVAPSLAKQRRKRKGRSIGLQEGWWRKTEIVFMFQPRFLWAACSPATIS